MTDADTLNALAGASEKFAGDLMGTIADLRRLQPPAAARLAQATKARTDALSATARLNDAAAGITLGGTAATKLDALTTAVDAQSERIASEEADLTRAVGVAAGLLSIARDVATGNVADAATQAVTLTGVVNA